MLSPPIVGSIKPIHFIVHPSLFLWIYVVVGIHEYCVIKGGPHHIPCFVRLKAEVMGHRDRFGLDHCSFQKGITGPMPSNWRCHDLLMESELVSPNTKTCLFHLATPVRMLQSCFIVNNVHLTEKQSSFSSLFFFCLLHFYNPPLVSTHLLSVYLLSWVIFSLFFCGNWMETASQLSSCVCMCVVLRHHPPSSLR